MFRSLTELIRCEVLGKHCLLICLLIELIEAVLEGADVYVLPSFSLVLLISLRLLFKIPPSLLFFRFLLLPLLSLFIYLSQALPQPPPF